MDSTFKIKKHLVQILEFPENFQPFEVYVDHEYIGAEMSEQCAIASATEFIEVMFN